MINNSVERGCRICVIAWHNLMDLGEGEQPCNTVKNNFGSAAIREIVSNHNLSPISDTSAGNTSHASFLSLSNISWNLQAMVTDGVTSPQSRPMYDMGITRKKVQEVDPNRGHCLVTNASTTLAVDYCHCIPRKFMNDVETSLSGRRLDRPNSSDFLWFIFALLS